MRACNVCQSPDRASIDLKLLAHQTASSISREHGIKIDCLLRHKANHLKQASESETLSSMLRTVIAELDDAAAAALNKGDIRARIDALKRKADAIQSCLQNEREQKKKSQVTGGDDDGNKRVSLAMLDKIVSAIEKNYDLCPMCGSYTILKGQKPSGIPTGKVQ